MAISPDPVQAMQAVLDDLYTFLDGLSVGFDRTIHMQTPNVSMGIPPSAISWTRFNWTNVFGERAFLGNTQFEELQLITIQVFSRVGSGQGPGETSSNINTWRVSDWVKHLLDFFRGSGNPPPFSGEYSNARPEPQPTPEEGDYYQVNVSCLYRYQVART